MKHTTLFAVAALLSLSAIVGYAQTYGPTPFGGSMYVGTTNPVQSLTLTLTNQQLPPPVQYPLTSPQTILLNANSSYTFGLTNSGSQVALRQVPVQDPAMHVWTATVPGSLPGTTNVITIVILDKPEMIEKSGRGRHPKAPAKHFIPKRP
jgi:hypothetical protein